MTAYSDKNAVRRTVEYKRAKAARDLRRSCGGKFGQLRDTTFNEYAKGTRGFR